MAAYFILQDRQGRTVNGERGDGSAVLRATEAHAWTFDDRQAAATAARHLAIHDGWAVHAVERHSCAHCASHDGSARIRPGLVGDDATCDRCARSIEAGREVPEALARVLDLVDGDDDDEPEDVDDCRALGASPLQLAQGRRARGRR